MGRPGVVDRTGLGHCPGKLADCRGPAVGALPPFAWRNGACNGEWAGCMVAGVLPWLRSMREGVCRLRLVGEVAGAFP